MSIDQATGERGVFKFEQPKYESRAQNLAILENPAERGEWRYDLESDQLVPHERMQVQVSAPFVITDEIPPTESMVDESRAIFTSKAKLRGYMREYNARHGTDYVETGDVREQPKPKPIDREARRREILDDAARAANLVKYGMAPLTEREREQCLREDREYERYKREREG